MRSVEQSFPCLHTFGTLRVMRELRNLALRTWRVPEKSTWKRRPEVCQEKLLC